MPTTKQTPADAQGIRDPASLGNAILVNAILVAEDEEANYEPIAVAMSISEGKELAQDDLRERLRRLERDEDPGLCPYQYQLWARGVDGRRHVAASWFAAEL